MSENKTKNYFDKFIDDQLKRSKADQERRRVHQQTPEGGDKKRDLLKMYRERVSHLIRRGNKNGR
jgi:hypothetical protein